MIVRLTDMVGVAAISFLALSSQTGGEMISGMRHYAAVEVAATSPRMAVLPLDDCSDCWQHWEQEGYPSTGWSAGFMEFAGEECDGYGGGLPTPDGQCIRCFTECVGANGNQDGFEDEEDATQWLHESTECGDCDSSNGELSEALLGSVRANDAARAALLLYAAGDSVWLNRERAAIQGVGCSASGVGLHVPVRRDFADAVSLELASLSATKVRGKP